jgi:hypothetical protein
MNYIYRPMSRTLLGRFLFEELELLQVLMEGLGPGSGFIEQCWLLQSICPTFWTSDDAVTTRHLRQRWLTVVVKLYPLEPTNLPLSTYLAICRCQKATGEALFDIIVGIINDKEDHPKTFTWSSRRETFAKCVKGIKNC